MNAQVRGKVDIHTTDESRPMDSLMLSNMTAMRLVRHFWGFALFIVLLAFASSFESSNGWAKIGMIAALVLSAIASVVPWLTDLKRR